VGLINETEGVVQTATNTFWKIDHHNVVNAQNDWFVGER